jgi:hypothetical protein
MKHIYRLLLLLIVFAGCKEKYVGSIHFPPTGYLVVEGFINSGIGATHIRLTRATSLDSIYIHDEAGATINVESDHGESYPLSEIAPGQYESGQLSLNPAEKYRLQITTSNGMQYVSDYAEVKITPPIDSVSHLMGGDAASVYVSTHDDQNKSIYYQWTYEETWIYDSPYFSYYIYTNHQLVQRDNENQIAQCWENDTSTDIIVSSSAKLSQDVISNFLVTTVPYATSGKLNHRYSILVKQYTLTKDWYEWKENTKKNTEQLGTIFDAQPSQATGNIHSVSDANETVIGFVGCTSETEKRIFIDNGEIPGNIHFDNLHGCILDSLHTLDSTALSATFNNGYLIPVSYITAMGMPVGITYSGYECVDCRTHGGTTIQPGFWQ